MAAEPESRLRYLPHAYVAKLAKGAAVIGIIQELASHPACRGIVLKNREVAIKNPGSASESN